jgi:hypothetical protein
MKDITTARQLAGDDHWPVVPLVTVPGDDTAKPMPPGATQPEGELVVRNWTRVAVLEIRPVTSAYYGFIAGDHAQLMNVPVELVEGQFGVRVGDGTVKFFVVPTDLRSRIKLKLVEVTNIDDPRYSHLPLY